MIKFEKIKTSADKRHALANRNGKPVANDFTKGDNLFITEKVDGHNASFSSKGIAFSREKVIDHKTNGPLVPFADFVDQLLPYIEQFIAQYLDASHDYQFYGEFMVHNRVVQYNEDIYNKWFMFDILDTTTNRYLGTQTTIAYASVLKQSLPEELSIVLRTPEILSDSYTFTSYSDLELFVHGFQHASHIGTDGIMEGAVANNLSRQFQNKALRAKIINKAFKETQRIITNDKNHTVAKRELMQYLTQSRVSKIVFNLRDTGDLQPLSPTYYKQQLEMVVRLIAKDINDESDLNLPVETMTTGDKSYNKIEAMARLTMIDLRNSL